MTRRLRSGRRLTRACGRQALWCEACLTAADAHGTMCLRWIRAEAHPDPETRVVTLADLKR